MTIHMEIERHIHNGRKRQLQCFTKVYNVFLHIKCLYKALHLFPLQCIAGHCNTLQSILLSHLGQYLRLHRPQQLVLASKHKCKTVHIPQP